MNNNEIKNDTNTYTCIGVIIPVYNGEKYLQEAVYSVLSQECKDLIVVIINDGSKDNSLAIAEQIAAEDSRVYVLNQKNQGVSVARNNGIEFLLKKNVKYIAFLDSDDVWCDGFYTEDLKDTFLSNKSDVFHFSWFYGNESLSKGKLNKAESAEFCGYELSPWEGHFCSHIFNAALFADFDVCFPEGIKLNEDVVFLFYIIAFSKKMVVIDRNSFIYRSNASSVVHSKKKMSIAYFESVIPSWYWLMDKMSNIDNNEAVKYRKSQCLTMIKTYLCEYIKEAIKNGEPLKEIEENIKNSKYIYLFNDPDVWVDNSCLEFWNAFHKKPSWVWIKTRIYSIIFNTARKYLRNNKFIQKRRYNIDLSAYYTKQQLP